MKATAQEIQKISKACISNRAGAQECVNSTSDELLFTGKRLFAPSTTPATSSTKARCFRGGCLGRRPTSSQLSAD